MMTADVYNTLGPNNRLNPNPNYAATTAGPWMAPNGMPNNGCAKFSSTSAINTNGPGPPSLNASAFHHQAMMMENYYNSHGYGQPLLIKSGNGEILYLKVGYNGLGIKPELENRTKAM